MEYVAEWNVLLRMYGSPDDYPSEHHTADHLSGKGVAIHSTLIPRLTEEAARALCKEINPPQRPEPNNTPGRDFVSTHRRYASGSMYTRSRTFTEYAICFPTGRRMKLED